MSKNFLVYKCRSEQISLSMSCPWRKQNESGYGRYMFVWIKNLGRVYKISKSQIQYTAVENLLSLKTKSCEVKEGWPHLHFYQLLKNYSFPQNKKLFIVSVIWNYGVSCSLKCSTVLNENVLTRKLVYLYSSIFELGYQEPYSWVY